MRALRAEFGDRIGLSLPSTRVDSFSVDTALLCAPRKKSSMTFAPEAGSQRLRNAVSKVVADKDLLHAARNAFENGWSSIKLYFMVGLPTETMADVQGIVDWASQVKAIGARDCGQAGAVCASPPQTTCPRRTRRSSGRVRRRPPELAPKHELLRRGCRSARLDFTWNDPGESILEGALSRGDRRLSAVVETAWRNGARFDAWSEHFNQAAWNSAFAEHQIDPAFYCHRERDLWERFPWMHIASGVSEAFLRKEWMRTQRELTTIDCRDGCNVCGMEHAADLCELKLGDLIAQRRAGPGERVVVL